jgi:predicted acylesterase/phospholipase RssA
MLTPQVSVVFSGGVALGAYQAGAYATLHDHKELRPQHLAGSSIGAVNAALIAGNMMPKAVEALKMFWDTVALEPPEFVPWFCYAGHWPSQHAYSWLSVLHARLSGRAGVFYPRLPALMFGNATSVYDLSPLGARLEEFIDFKRLNDGLIRVSVVTTDAAASCQIFRQSKSMAGCLEMGVSRQTRQLRQFWMKRQKIGITSVSCWTSFHLRATGRGRSKTPQRGAGICYSAIRPVAC